MPQLIANQSILFCIKMNLAWLFEYSQNDYNMSNFQGYFQLIVNIIKMKLYTHSFWTGRRIWDSQFGSSFSHIFFEAFILRFPLVRFYDQFSSFKSNFSYIGKHDELVEWSHENAEVDRNLTVVISFSFQSTSVSVFFFLRGGGSFPVCDIFGIWKTFSPHTVPQLT